jgi:hypothetical protein
MALRDYVVDVETSGPAWAELDRATREYLARRAYGDEWRTMPEPARAEVVEAGNNDRIKGTALELGLCRIIAIGIWHLDHGWALISARTEADEQDGECERGTYSVCSEATALRTFWRVVAGRSRIVTYNGRNFDGPVLMIRSAQLGVVPTRNLVPYRYDLSEHADIADVLSFQGTRREIYSLDYWCRAFGIPSPKDGGVTGATAGEVWEAGEFARLADYVLGDVWAEAQLWDRVAPIACHFKGGPDIAEVVGR